MKVLVVAVLAYVCGGHSSFLSLDVEAPPMRGHSCDSGVMEDSSSYIFDPQDVADAGISD